MQPQQQLKGNHPIADPFQAMRDFCHNYHHHEVQTMLWDWLVTALSRNNTIYDEGKERSSLFLLYENLTLLVAAAYTVHQKPAPATAPTKKATAKNKKSGPSKS